MVFVRAKGRVAAAAAAATDAGAATGSTPLYVRWHFIEDNCKVVVFYVLWSSGTCVATAKNPVVCIWTESPFI